ncbi:MAG: hypothetical protein ACYSPI_08455 [Planctomycetota bacterium]
MHQVTDQVGLLGYFQAERIFDGFGGDQRMADRADPADARYDGLDVVIATASTLTTILPWPSIRVT